MSESDIVPGQIAGRDDSPKRIASTSLHQNDVLMDFIKNRLLKKHFCVLSESRNNRARVAGAKIRDNAADSAEPSKSAFGKFIPRELSPLEVAWDKLQHAYKLSDRKEISLYRPLCKVLTLFAESSYLFIPWDKRNAGESEEPFRQGILAVNAQRKDTDKFLHGDLALSDLPDEFLYRDKGQVRPRVYYSDIQMVGEVKSDDAPEFPQEYFDHATRVLKYLFTTSRYQPRHAYHIGFLAYHNGFVVIEYYPDRAFFSHLFAWDDPDAQIALKQATDDIKNRKFTTEEFESINATLRHDKSPLGFTVSGKFTRGNAVYRLFDLHRGEGWHRNVYVGIGVGEQIDTRPDWKVIKHYWHDTGLGRFDELHILQHIYRRPLTSGEKRCTTGIVRVNFDESRVLMRCDTPGSSGSLTDRDHVSRESVLLMMESLGHALSSCSSVMQFLKAMYDLVEVHRMLVEDHQVLHRDISWGNVLTNPTHVDKDQQDDLCDRPFIDAIHNVEPEARKVHVMLSDFDRACILGSKMRESTTRGEITGTPMFMARSLCAPLLECTQNTDPRAVCRLVFPAGATAPTDQRRKEVEQFLEIVNEHRNLLISDQIPSISIKPQSGIAHAPMHDAESIFWLIVVFFLRAHPKDYYHTDPMSGERERRLHRTNAFKSMVMNGIETGLDSRKAPTASSLPPQFHPFVEMLRNLDLYFRQSWHDPSFSKLGSNSNAFRFHAHNALQVVLLDAINKLQTTGDYIELYATPLGVDDDFPYILLSKSYVSANLKIDIPDEGEGDKKAKKQKTTQETKTSSPVIAKSNRDNAAEMIKKNPEFKTLMSAIDHYKQNKRWFMGDREYVEHAFVP